MIDVEDFLSSGFNLCRVMTKIIALNDGWEASTRP